MKKRYILLPLGAAGLYVAWRWYQAGQSSSEDTATSSGLYASDDLSDYGLSTTGGSTTVTGNTGNVTTDATSSAVDDNAEWTNTAIERLTNQGYDGAVVAAALGEFLARRSLDSSEASIARAALAVAGQPPENRPWSVIEAATTGTATPGTPTGLKVTSTAQNAVSLSWSPVTGAAYYDVYRSGAAANAVRSVAPAATVSGLQPNTSYSFQVAAVGTTNQAGTRSGSVTGKTKAVSLARPTGLKASSVTRTSFRVTCGKVAGATYYRWEINGKAAAPSDQPYRDFTGMRPGTTYSITVSADTTNQSPGPESSALKVTTKK